MDRREEDALHEVDRIGVAVQHLRDLLLAATEAELRAQGRTTDPAGDHHRGSEEATH